MMRAAITTLMIFGLAAPVFAANPNAGFDKSGVCQGCHGGDGNSPVAAFPSLAGQPANYLAKQLKDYRSGNRKNETMDALAASLSDEDIADIAAYFASQKPTPTGSDAKADTLALGKLIYKGGNMDTGLTACASCHGPQGKGNGPAKFPALAGQHADYTVSQLQNFKIEIRSNDMNNMMRNVSARMTQKEMDAVAAYLATLNH